MTARRGALLVGVLLAALLVAGRVVAGAYAEWAWYHALNADGVWAAQLSARAVWQAGLFLVAFGFSFANLLGMRRSIVSLVLPRRLGNLEIGEAIPGGALTLVAALGSLIIAAAFSIGADDWMALWRARWAVPIGESDPYLQADMAFWMAWLPLERVVHEWAVSLAVVVGATVMALYGMTPSVRLDRGHVHISTWVRRHFAIYSAFLLLLVAWGYRLDAYDTLIHGSGAREAFTAFDHRVRYPYLIALGFGTVAAALFVAWSGWRGRQRATISALLLMLVAGPVMQLALPMLDRRAALESERARLERSYQAVSALYTRRAYRVDEIVRGAAADSVRVAPANLARGASAWDESALTRALADDPAVPALTRGVAWRVSADAGLRAAVLYGDVNANPVSRIAVVGADPTDADERGAPWPDVSGTVSALPAAFIGGTADGVRIVDDTLGRIAAPPFAAGWRRLALAWGERKIRLVASDADASRARLITRRDVRERVRALYPFFAIGTVPQAVVVGDSLWWSVEVFNASDSYPLTEPFALDGGVVRHAVLAGIAIVNAHTGRVRVVLPERPDRVTRWWQARLASMFVSRTALDPALLAALPPLIETPRLQGLALARTGFRGDTLSARPLFQADDADLELMGDGVPPFVSDAAGHPLAWAVAAVDASERVRGALVSVGGVRPRTVFVESPDSLRWAASLDRLQRAADSTGASRGRRHPRRGRVQVIPTTDGLRVVQSFYDWAPEREPAQAGVVILSPAGTSAGPTLSAALGGAARVVSGDRGLQARVARAYGELRAAMARGDWVAMGRAMDALGQLATPRR